eukprot:2949382-Amphidinium_carterae.1
MVTDPWLTMHLRAGTVQRTYKARTFCRDPKLCPRPPTQDLLFFLFLQQTVTESGTVKAMFLLPKLLPCEAAVLAR